MSVIIPCYNHGRYLPDALDSVLAQTYDDWEAIVIDDGSTDDTAAVARRYVTQDARIRYIYQPNAGLPAARNAGIRVSRGELTALLDADDAWRQSFLERMAGALGKNPEAAAAYCGFQYMDAEGNLLPTVVCRDVAPVAFRDELLVRNWLSACAVVARKSVYEQAGPFDESLRACEDYDMWLRMSRSHRFVAVPEVLMMYRRAGSNMSDDVDRMTLALSQVLERYLGSLASPPDTWSEDKRVAVSQVYSMRAQECLAQGRGAESAEALCWLLRWRPDLATSLDLWYSLACAHQLKGQRGDFASWQPVRAESDLEALVSSLYVRGVPAGSVREISAQVSFAQALLNYGASRYGAARKHLASSIGQTTGLRGLSSRLRLAARLLPGAGQAKAVATRLTSRAASLGRGQA